METIFVNLELTKEDRKPSEILKTSLNRNEDLISFKSKQGQRVNRVLVRGVAGSGKSTLIANMAYTWALQQEDNPLNDFSLVFVISIRELQGEGDLTEAIFDQVFSEDSQVPRVGLANYIANNAHSILLLVDGMDEGRSNLVSHETGELGKVLANKRLRSCCTVLTTRPYAVENLRTKQQIYTQVKLTGFSEQNIDLYIYKFFREDTITANGLISELKRSVNIRSLSSIPVMLLMQCLLWLEQHKLPETQTGLYQESIEYMWRRFLEKEKGHFGCNPDEVNNLLLRLGKVVLDEITRDSEKVIFHETDFPAEIYQLAYKVGLLTKERLRSRLNVKQAVTFVHKSFQEFCAARYVVQAKNLEDGFNLCEFAATNIAQKHGILAFACGLESKIASEILQLVGKRLETSGVSFETLDMIWPLLDMFLESDLPYESVQHIFAPFSGVDPNSTLGKIMAKNKEAENNKNRPNLPNTSPPSPPGSMPMAPSCTPKSVNFDCTSKRILFVVNEFLSKSALFTSSQFRHLNLELKVSADKYWFPIVVSLLKKLSIVKELILHPEPQFLDGTEPEKLNQSLGVLSSLQSLTIGCKDVNITELLAAMSVSDSKTSRIDSISLSGVRCDLNTMVTFLNKQKSLDFFSVEHTKFEEDDIGPVFMTFKDKCIKSLKFRHTTVSSSLVHLASCIQFQALEELDLTDAGLKRIDVIWFSEHILKQDARNVKLQTLNMSRNAIASALIPLSTCLSHILEQNSMSLKFLFLHHCDLTDKGVIALADRFDHLRGLEMLNLDENPKVGLRGVEAILRGLQRIPKLYYLKLGPVSVKPDDVIPDIVADCLAVIGLHTKSLRPLFTINVEYAVETIEKMRSAANKYNIAGFL